MDRKGYKDGLVNRVKNKYSRKKYTISTARELGKDYWTVVVMPSKLFGLWFDWAKRYTFVRNNREDAYGVHGEVKEIAESIPEKDWFEKFPRPKPLEGYSKDAKRTLGPLDL